MKGGETVSKQGNRNFPHLTLATVQTLLVLSSQPVNYFTIYPMSNPTLLFPPNTTVLLISKQTVTYKGAVYTALTLNIQPGLLRPDFAPSKQLQPCNSPYFTDVCIHYYRTQASYLKCIMLTFISVSLSLTQSSNRESF